MSLLDGKPCECAECVLHVSASGPSTIAEALEYATQEPLPLSPRLAAGTGPVALPARARSPQNANGEIVEPAAQLLEALDYLRRLVQYLDKYGGYMSSANQQALRGARRLLAERGR